MRLLCIVFGCCFVLRVGYVSIGFIWGCVLLFFVVRNVVEYFYIVDVCG